MTTFRRHVHNPDGQHNGHRQAIRHGANSRFSTKSPKYIVIVATLCVTGLLVYFNQQMMLSIHHGSTRIAPTFQSTQSVSSVNVPDFPLRKYNSDGSKKVSEDETGETLNELKRKVNTDSRILDSSHKQDGGRNDQIKFRDKLGNIRHVDKHSNKHRAMESEQRKINFEANDDSETESTSNVGTPRQDVGERGERGGRRVKRKANEVPVLSIPAGSKDTASEVKEIGIPAGSKDTASEVKEIGFPAGNKDTASEVKEIGVSAGNKDTASEVKEIGFPTGNKDTASKVKVLGKDTASEVQVLGIPADNKNTGNSILKQSSTNGSQGTSVKSLNNYDNTLSQSNQNTNKESPENANVTVANLTESDTKPRQFVSLGHNKNHVKIERLKFDRRAATSQNRLLKKRRRANLPCLSFFHIPKTGGTTIEDLAYNYNLKWGFRGWRLRLIERAIANQQPGIHIPRFYNFKYPDLGRYNCGPLWHVPISLFDLQTSRLPYEDCDLFSIVRNPYTRWISRYNSQWSGYDGPDGDNPKQMNVWINQEIDEIEQNITYHVSHKAPQWVHFYDQFTGEKVEQMKYALKFEELFEQKNTTSFNNLMEEYDILLRLNTTAAHKQKGQEGTRKSFTPMDLSQETRDRIYKVFKRDFELFGYDREWKPNKKPHERYEVEESKDDLEEDNDSDDDSSIDLQYSGDSVDHHK